MFNIRLETWLNLVRSLPLYVLVLTLLESIIFFDIRGLLLFLVGMFSEVFNMLLKIIFKFLFYKYGTFKDNGYYLPLLGRGDRPRYAKDCSFFKNCDSINKFETSFGFPSGHSQFIMVFASLLILFIYNKNKNWFSILSVLLLSILAVYTRIQIKCHTIQQVIFGSLIGIGIGYGFFFLFEKYF